MASAVDIVNLALALLGEDATVSSISPPEGSAQAEHCARFYPIARNALLEMHDWSFATKRIALQLLDTDELPDTWEYAYAYPNLCLRPLRVLEADYIDDNDKRPFEVEALQDGTRVIFTNTEDANVVYIAAITDTTKFSGLFVNALARLLASYLAGPIIKGTTGMQVSQAQLKQFYSVEYPLATANDCRGRENPTYSDYVPAGIKARA